MAGKGTGKTRVTILFFILLLAVLACLSAASADDAEQLKYLPGQWFLTDTVEKDGEAPQDVDLVLTLTEGGKMTLSFSGGSSYTYACEGTWSSEFVPDGMDRLRLLFTSTGNPLYAGSPYSVECVFDFYTESWVENDTWNIYMIFSGSNCSGLSPFEEVYGYNDLALNRQQGPNMRIVNCNEFVSLRSGPSTSPPRIAKVPLGALVLAIPGAAAHDGFVWCTYQDEYGYILSQYLQSVDSSSSGKSSSVIYGLTIDRLATRKGPGTQYEGGGTYNVKGEYIRILSRAYDKRNGIWWVKCEIPYHGQTRVLWTGWKRFDSTVTDLNSIPIDPEY